MEGRKSVGEGKRKLGRKAQKKKGIIPIYGCHEQQRDTFHGSCSLLLGTLGFMLSVS
jgi:hypothetical protein